MDARHLALLRELGERGSVTAVATALHLTPSAVSQQLSILQRGVPVPLTRLDGRVLILTDAGRSLAAAATEVAAALARADAAVDVHLGDATATVRVAAFHSAASAFFPDLFRVSRARLECADEDVAQDDFPRLSATYDVVIAHCPGAAHNWPRTVSVTPLMVEPLDVALPVAHPLTAQSRLRARDVAGEPWIAVHDGFPLAAAVRTIGDVAGRSLDVRHRINDFTVAADLVAAGAGLALTPRHTRPRRPDIVVRPIVDVHLNRRIDILTRPEQRFRTAVNNTVDELLAIAGSLTSAEA